MVVWGDLSICVLHFRRYTDASLVDTIRMAIAGQRLCWWPRVPHAMTERIRYLSGLSKRDSKSAPVLLLIFDRALVNIRLHMCAVRVCYFVSSDTSRHLSVLVTRDHTGGGQHMTLFSPRHLLALLCFTVQGFSGTFHLHHLCSLAYRVPLSQSTPERGSRG